MDQALLHLLRCPLTGSPLTEADPSLVERLNRAIRAGGVTNRMGQKCERSLTGGLVNQDQTYLFPVDNDIACLLIDEALPLEQLEASDER